MKSINITNEYVSFSANHALSISNDHSILFLDRDGVLNVDTGYPKSADILIIKDNIIRIKDFVRMNDIDHVIIVSNQSGVARGYFSAKEAAETMDLVIDTCHELGLKIQRYIFAITHPTKALYSYLKRESTYRKPNSGMLRHFVCDSHPKHLLYLWGDKESDMMAALDFGIPPSNISIIQ